MAQPTAQAMQLTFGKGDLHAVRDLVKSEAAGASLSDDQEIALVVAVNELAGNSVRYGGGDGTLRLWREPAALVAEVSDRGWIEEPPSRRHPAPEQKDGRGLWMVDQLCDAVQIRSNPEGTCVRVRIRIGSA